LPSQLLPVTIHYLLRNHYLEFTLTAYIPALIGPLAIDRGEIGSTKTINGTSSDTTQLGRAAQGTAK
jgi:hypothetical protein